MSRSLTLRRVAVVVVVGAVVPMVALAQPKPGATTAPVVAVSDGGVTLAPGTVLPGQTDAAPAPWVNGVKLSGMDDCDGGGTLPDAGKMTGFTSPLQNGCMVLGSDKYNRGAGHLPFCEGGFVQSGAVCYKPCREGYELIAGRCYKPCPKGFDTVSPTLSKADASRGLVCRKPAPYDRGAGYAAWDEDKCKKEHKALGCEKWGAMWYPKCRANYHNVASNICSPDCPAGFTDTGVDCARDSYGPESKPLTECGPYEEKIGGLCYAKCKTGYVYSPGDMPFWCTPQADVPAPKKK